MTQRVAFLLLKINVVTDTIVTSNAVAARGIIAQHLVHEDRQK